MSNKSKTVKRFGDMSMTWEYVSGSKLNTMVSGKVFKDTNIDTSDVKLTTGLSIEELTYSWVFESRNNFKECFNEWKSTGKLMNFQEIRGY